MNREQVIAWLRAEARKLSDAADSLEEKSGGGGLRLLAAPANGSVTAEQVRARLAKGSSRVPHLAKEFGCDQETLRAIVRNPKNGIKVHQRGWLKLK